MNEILAFIGIGLALNAIIVIIAYYIRKTYRFKGIQKLYLVQKTIRVGKSQYNSFGKYHYRSCEDIFEAIKELQNKLAFVIYLNDEIVFKEGRYYVEATATFVDIEHNFQVSVKASAREEEIKKGMDGSQITGASSSYARKYALNGLLLLDDVRDSDATNTHNKDVKPENVHNKEVKVEKHELHTDKVEHNKEVKPEKPELSADKVEKAAEYIKSGKGTLDDILKKYRVSKEVLERLKALLK